VSEAERLAALAEVERLGTDEAFQASLRNRHNPGYAENSAIWLRVNTQAYPPPEKVTARMVTLTGNLACGEAAQRYSVDELDAALLARLREQVSADTYAA
jgi:hypothetical protein